MDACNGHPEEWQNRESAKRRERTHLETTEGSGTMDAKERRPFLNTDIYLDKYFHVQQQLSSPQNYPRQSNYAWLPTELVFTSKQNEGQRKYGESACAGRGIQREGRASSVASRDQQAFGDLF